MTAVEWLLQHVCLNEAAQANELHWDAVKNIAAAMEKEQIEKAYTKGCMVGENEDVLKYAKQYSEKYYNETFKKD